MDRMNLGLLVVIVATTAVLGIMTSSIATGIFSQHANAIMWGLAHCWHNPNVGLICTHGHSGQGGHPHPILEKLRQAGGMKNATAAGANMTRNAK
jgi:hypothetical protein